MIQTSKRNKKTLLVIPTQFFEFIQKMKFKHDQDGYQPSKISYSSEFEYSAPVQKVHRLGKTKSIKNHRELVNEFEFTQLQIQSHL